jgi:pimeloyl-ACP methyl ester carboxylesterase
MKFSKIKPAGDLAGFDEWKNPIYRIKCNDINIGYKILGKGEPLLMLIGLGNTMSDWPEEMLSLLAENYQLILMDNRGMGYSTHSDRPFSYKIFADDVINLLEALEIKKTNILGYSMGSAVTQLLLAHESHRFDKVIIHATATEGKSAHQIITDKMAKKNIEELPEVIQRQLDIAPSWNSPTNQLSKIKNSILLIVGTDDDIVETKSSIQLSKIIPESTLILFKGGTHRLIWEKPVDFAKNILGFLSKTNVGDNI